MSNALANKARTIMEVLAANGLTKVAGQDVQHIGVTSGQKSLGKEMTEEIKDGIGSEATVASTPAAANKPKDQVQEIPNCQSLNKDPEQALASTGTDVNSMAPCGAPASLPKSAADYRSRLANIQKAITNGRQEAAPVQQKQASFHAFQLAGMLKQASLQKLAAEGPFTGTEAIRKIASLTDKSTDAEMKEAYGYLDKLAATNPMFCELRDSALMRKMAEDVDALAEAEGISPDEAAASLDEAMAANPEMAAELEDEADGEALGALAEDEQDAAAMDEGLAALAANASEVTGEEVTPEDIAQALETVSQAAEEAGVPPEALLQAAVEEMNADQPDVSEEDVAAAQQILDEAAAQGVSPDEVIQMAAGQLGGEGAPAEEAPAESPAEEPEQEKQASLRNTPSMRVQYVSHLRNSKK